MNYSRRQVAGFGLALPFASSALFAQPAGRASPVDSLGINTHLAQGEMPERVSQALDFLGVRHIRDGAPKGPKAERYHSVLQHGVRLTAVIGAHRPLADTIASLEALERAQHGCLAAIEGPNEINNFPFSYQNQSGLPAALAFQADLLRSVRESRVLHDVPVIAFTDIEMRDCPSDFFNFHPYPKGGRPITGQLGRIMQRVAASGSPHKPIQFTEFGYSTAEVTEQQQADLLVDGWRQAIAAGVRRVFIYQLSDFYRDTNPSQAKLGNHYGLFTLDYKPKKSALAIAHLLRG